MSTWVELSGLENKLDQSDRPRKLTQTEIRYIVNQFPISPSADAAAANVARECSIKQLTDSLKNAEVCPSAIPALIKKIIDYHYESLIAPGTPVGIIAAEIVGMVTTQMTLNSVAPWEKIIFQNVDSTVSVVEIGPWIDSLLESNPDKIVHIPENRTQYLELQKPVLMPTPNFDGSVSWDQVTAVTRHLPLGDLVKIKTQSGRQVTVTQSKSLLLWDGTKLVQRDGSSAKVGDLMPILCGYSDPFPVYTDQGLDKNFGYFVGSNLSLSSGDLENSGEGFSHSKNAKQVPNSYFECDIVSAIPSEILLGNSDFVKGVMSGYYKNFGSLDEDNKIITITFPSDHAKWHDAFGFLCNRLGIFTKKMDLKYLIEGDYVEMWYQNILNNGDVKVHDKNIVLDAIVSIEMCDSTKYNIVDDNPTFDESLGSTKYVYDLTVPSTTNFSLYNGLGIADTFHASGSAKSVSAGIETMRDLIYARDTPKNEHCTIYYTDKTLTYEQVLDTRQHIVGSVVSNFVKDYDIDSPQNLEQYWWHESDAFLLDKQIPKSTKVMRLMLDIGEMYKQKVTIDMIAQAIEKSEARTIVAVYGPMSDGIIDLYPDSSVLNQAFDKCDLDIDSIPIHLTEMTYLESCVYPELDNLRVKGVSGIKQLFPVESKVLSAIMEERKLRQDDLTTQESIRGLQHLVGYAWVLIYNPEVMKNTGLTPENLANLCNLAGINVVTGFDDMLVVLMSDNFKSDGKIIYKENDRTYAVYPESDILNLGGTFYIKANTDFMRMNPSAQITNVESTNYFSSTVIVQDNEHSVDITNFNFDIKETKPTEYINAKISSDKDKYNDEINRLTKISIEKSKTLPENKRSDFLRKPINVPRSDLMKAAEFIIAETDGSNLKELLAMPGIDKTRTTCNNMKTIASTLGIEAARNFIIKALTKTISNTDAYIHPVHIKFIAEFICSLGWPYGATYTGISRQPGGHLSLATLERAGQGLTKSALNGRKESTKNTSAAIIVGTRVSTGNGYFDIAQDITVGPNNTPETVINDELFTALQRDNASNALLEQVEQQDNDLLDKFQDLITLGQQFDRTADTEVDALNLFTKGAMIPPLRTEKPAKYGQVFEPLRGKQVTPSELMDTLNLIKTGTVVDDPNVRISVVGTRTVDIINKEIESEGLVTDVEFRDIEEDDQLPNSILNLLKQYSIGSKNVPDISSEDDGNVEELMTHGPVETEQFEQPAHIQTMETVYKDLPGLPILGLPDLGGQVQSRTTQARPFAPIDVSVIKETLERQ